MTIKREDIDRRIVGFSDVASGRRLPPVHPGEILRDEFLTPMGISVYELANAIKVPRSRANDIVLGRRAITTDTAMRLGRYFGMSPEFWINLQARYDLDVANRTVRRKIEQEVAPRSAATVVVLSEEEYSRLTGARSGQRLVDLLGSSPLRDVEIEHPSVRGPVRDVDL